jgi:hypothetical protein
MTPFRTRIFTAIICVLCVSLIATATELRVRFQVPPGASVTIEKAELLLIGWGWTDQLALPVNGSVVRLNFDSPELRLAIGDKNPSDVLLFVHAKGMTPAISERFTLPRPGSGPMTVSFRNGPSTTIAEGAVSEIVVTLKRPSARVVVFSTMEGNPSAA